MRERIPDRQTAGRARIAASDDIDASVHPNVDPNEHTNREWPRFTFDLHDFREDDGAMLKLVLGLRWKPGAGNSQGSEYTRTTKEFWLVSFKAKLEES